MSEDPLLRWYTHHSGAHPKVLHATPPAHCAGAELQLAKLQLAGVSEQPR
jgi:hypothetical protein